MTRRPYSQTVQQNFRDVMGTPAAPEVFDDESPVLPVVDVSLQKNSASTLLVAPAFFIPATSQTLRLMTGAGTGAAATLGTVTSGKTFHVYGFTASGSVADQAQLLTSADGGQFAVRIAAGGYAQIVAGSVPLCAYLSGTNVRVSAAATTNVMTVWGFEF